MLNFAPDGMAGGGSPVCSQEQVMIWEINELPGESLLLSLLAASRETAISATSIAFQPERISGFCASS